MNNRVGGWGCAFTKLSGEEFQGTLLACAEVDASQNSRRGRLCQGRPLPLPLAFARKQLRSLILSSLPGEGGTPKSAAPLPLLAPPLLYSFFLFLPPVRLSAILSPCLRPSACCCCCSGDNCISLYNPERLFRAHNKRGHPPPLLQQTEQGTQKPKGNNTIIDMSVETLDV